MTISFSGLASGLDTSSWVESLVKLKQAKIDTLQEEKEGIELTKDTLESIKSFFSSFRSMLEKVTDSKFGIAATDLFAQNLATSANLDVLTATATTEAEESTYNVLVDQLATNSAAKSNYSYMTTIIQTTTATADSKLINLGVKTGNIGVKVNGIERGIEITDSDTISSFIEKLQNIGVNASFNDKTGIFSMDISANDINDIDKTGIVNAFKLSGVNEGYTSNSLKITSTDTIYSAATNDTKLSELGAKAGTLIIKANDTEYKITIDENTTLGEFIKKLNDNKINANLDKTGILTIVDANITNEGTTNIKNALGLELDIYSNTQKSNDLSHKTVITQTTTATSDTLLKDLGGEIKDNQTVIVKNSNNEYTTITVGTSTTLGDLLTKISNAGLYAAIDTEGRVEISGGTITGGTFNAIKALGLTSEPYSAITTGKPLTETVRKAELVTLETKLVDEMKVRAGYIEVTDNDGNKFYEKIYHGQTIADFMSDMGNLGIYTKLRDDGVLEITGGAFATLSDDKVKELIANGTIRETDDRYKQGTDLLTCLYGSPVISTDQITVASTYSKSRALTKKVVNTIAASLTSTLGNLSLQADGTAIFDVRGDKRTIEVAKTDTLQNLMDKLKDVGIASSWNSNTQQFTIENATLEGGTANLGSVLNLTKTISGKYVTSNSLNKLETVTIDATRSTTLNKYGISNSMSDADRTIKLFDNNAKLVGSLTVTEATTIGDVLDFVNKNSGMKASIVDGILQIEGGYIENAALEKSMGLTTENKSSFALGSIMTVTTVAAVTGNTTLGQIISTLGTADAVKDGYSLTFNSKSLNVSATTTLDQLISQIFTNGGSASLDNTGRLSISGGVVAGSVATALGITTVSTTTAVSATGKTLVTTKTEYADLDTKMSDIGVSDNSTIILHNKLGSAYKTITVNGSTTVKDVFASLKAEGIDGTISNGVISLKSAEYKYITGTVATALGIGTQTVTDVVNTSVSSTVQITYTGEAIANLHSTLGEIGAITADNDSIIIYDKNKNAITTITTLTTNSTIEDMFTELAKYGITGSIKDGIISLDLVDGNYAAGSIMDNLGISVSTITISTTEAITVTSSAKVTYSETTTASATTTLGELLNTIKIDGTITASGITGTVIGISTVEDLINLQKLTDSGWYITRGKTFILMNDIDLSGVTDWTPIGCATGIYYSKMFCGTFDGQGHTISGLNITRTGYGQNTVIGLFGYLNGATIKNLKLDNFNFSATTTDVEGSKYLYTGGFLAAQAEQDNITSGVTVSGVTVTNSSATNMSISGLWSTTYGNATITNCSTDFTVTANISNNNAGIIGGLIANIQNTKSVSISQSSSTMNASGSFFLASGLVGYIYSGGATLNIDNCYFGGKISSTRNNDNNSICGLVGFYTDGTWSSLKASKLNISNSYVDAELSAPNGFVNTIIGGHYGPSTAVKNNITLNNVFYSESMASLGEININNDNGKYVNLERNNVGIASNIYDAMTKGNFNPAIWSYKGIIIYDNPYALIEINKDPQSSFTYNFNENSTLEDIMNSTLSLTLENGVLYNLDNVSCYYDGPLAKALGIRTTSTTVGIANTSSVAITFTSQTPATEDTLVGSCIDLSTGNTLVVNSGQKKAIATITISDTTTFKDLMDTLKENGINSTLINGILSLKPTNGNYVTGDVADKLGISLIKFIGMGTGGGGGSSTIEGGSTVDTALIGQLAYFLGNTTTINIKSSDGTVIATQEFYGYAKIDDLIRFFTKYGISAEVRDNILCLDNNEGIYAEDANSGGLLSQIGVGVTTKAVATSFLKEITTMTVDGAIAMSTVTSLVAGNTYAISSANDLVRLSKLVNDPTIIVEYPDKYYSRTITTQQSTTDCIFVLTKDIDMSSVAFSGIGTTSDSKRFDGAFYGNGHKIKNVSITLTGTSPQGFFGSVGSGTISDVTIENLTVGGDSSSAQYIGGLVGYLNGGKIDNCNIKNVKIAGISSSVNSSGAVVPRGGLVGYASQGSISNSNITGEISIINNSSTYNTSRIGGLVGYATRTTIENCFVDANMSGVFGGFIGDADYLTISNCSTSGTMTNMNSQYIGGFISYFGRFTKIQNSTSNVNISSSYAGSYCGGFIGYATITGGCTVSNCSASGNVNTTGLDVYTGGFVGGFANNNASDTNIFNNCYATGNVTSKTQSIYCSGGFYGYNDRNIYSVHTSWFNNCYASGTVSSGYGFGAIYDNEYYNNGGNIYYNSANSPTSSSPSIICAGTGITLAQMQNKDTMVANGFTEANGWTYETGKTPTLSNSGCSKTFAYKLLPVNTNSKNLQEIIDNGISGGNADGGLAISSDMLGNVVSFPSDYLTINIKNSEGTILKTSAFNKYSNVSDLLKFFNDNGINASMKDGVIYLDNDKGLYAEDAVVGGILSQMKISTTTKSVATSSFMTDIEDKSNSPAVAISLVTTLQAGQTYSIGSADDLKKLESLINSGQTGENCTFILTQDINMNGAKINIGYRSSDSSSGDRAFSGKFYGNGHKISNIRNTGDNYTSGLFGYIKNGSVQDLIVENITIFGETVGALVGTLYNGTIKNCTTQGDISLTFVKNTNSSSYSDSSYAGGLVGECLSTDNYSASNLITNIYVNGNITANGFKYVGGVVAYQRGTVNNCYANAKISTTAECAGGITGYLAQGSIYSCTTSGELVSSATGSQAGWSIHDSGIGGIVGTFTTAHNEDNDSIKSDIYNLSSSMNISSKSTSGGIVGTYYSTYYGSLRSCNASGTVSGNCAGGLIGAFQGTGASVTDCWASGNVNGTAQAGGLIGLAVSENFSDYNNGDYIYYETTSTIKNCLATGNVTGGNAAQTGGFIGQARQSDDSTGSGWIYTTLLVSGCYATGASSSGYGFCPLNTSYTYSGKSNNNYYNSTTNSSSGDTYYSNPTAVGMTSAELESNTTVKNIKNSSTQNNLKVNLKQQFTTVIVNTNSTTLHRDYDVSTNGGSGGSGGGGGSVVVTILTNSTSDLLITDIEGSLCQSTTLGELGLVDDKRILLKSDGQNYTVTIKATDTIGDMFTMLAGYDIAGAIDNNNKITLTGGKQSYITFIDNELADILKMGYGKDITYGDDINNTDSNTLLGTATIAMTTSSTLEKLGLKDSANIIVENNGKLYTVTVSKSQTVDDILTTLAGLGISGSVSDGKITLQGTADGIVKSMDATLENIFKIETGENKSWSGSTIEEIKNTDSKNLVYTTDGAIIDINTKLSDINDFANGNGKLVIHQTNGQFVTISIDATKTLGEFFTDISRYGLVGNINDGKVSIEGIGNVYMQATDGGSNILTALKLSNVVQNVQTVTVNRTSNILSHTVTVAASGTTQLGNLADSLGNTIGSGNGTIVLSTTSNAGNQNVTLTFDRTKSIYDVIDALAGYGINASLDALGKFSINSSTLTDFSISGNLGTLLMGTYTKVYGKGETFNISTNLVEKTTLPMSKTDLLSSFGITNGNFLITQQGVNYTVNIDTTQVKTVADFMKLLSSYGFESDIDSAGRLYVSGIGKSYLSSISGGSNILDKFGLTNWSLGDVKQESKHLGDYKVNNITCSLDTKLNQLTDASGSNLGISSGNIYVYQDGTRYLVNIDNNDTLQTLSAKLAQYGITMGLSTEGKLYFDGTNDSYMTTDGITNGASNILNRLNIAGNWSTRYDSTSESLSYTTKSNNIVSGSTKLADLQDSDGKNLGITTGAFYVYNSGSRSTESITADMTVNDLMATLAKHGLVADIAEDGSISIGAYNNTYLATSALTSDNSNIVSKLFSEWNFVNIYTSKGLDIPVDEVKSINRNTKLSAINEGKYQDGYITVVKDGVQTNIKLTSDDTVGTLMDELSLYGFESVINEKGQLLIKNTGNSLLQKYTGTEQASNALELLGIDLNNWIQTSSYKSDTLKVTQTSTIDSDVTRDTLLSELGVTTGEYNIFKNGVKYTAYISTGETMGSFLDTLKSFGIETSLVSDGDSSILTIIGSGDTYIAKSNSTTGASNVVEKLFANNDKYSSFRYKGLEQTSETVTHFTAATKDTLLSEFNKKDGSNTLTSVGDLSVTVNGETATIKIEADETFGSLIEKFKALGLEASISSTGQLMIQSGYNTFTINSDGTNSNLLSNVGLVYHKDLGGYVASTDTLKATTTTIEEKTFSVANYADYNTKMSLMNISSGTLSVYLNGQKATIKIDKNQTFGDLRSLVSTEFADVDLTFEDGYIKFYSKKDGDKVEVGATTDTSNFAAITGITSDGNGAVKSARELFCVNNSSVITNSGLFRKGDVTKGTFTVGNATFTIDDKTTISDIISQINSNDEANATAYWDSIEGNFVIKSRTTGSALINIEAGTSNFTDIMGFTNSEWAADGSLNVTRMNTASQEVGNNAKFSINGTYYTSTSNNITSDVSRIKGLTINLKGLTDGSAITLTVERDKETLANAVSDIVDSYNELMDNVDKEITKDGKLKDQSTLKLIRNQLRSLMTSSDAGTTIFRNLDAIGIKVEAASGNNISTSGLTTLTFDKDKFFEAFKSDQNAVKDLLIGSANNTGIFTKVENLVESSLKSVSGYFESADKSYQKQINKLDNKIEKQKTALERYRAQLESKFSSMDILIANMQQQYSSFLRT